MNREEIEIFRAGDRVFTIDIDGSRVEGTLKIAKTFRKENDFTVLWDDGEETIVLDFEQLWKIVKPSARP